MQAHSIIRRAAFVVTAAALVFAITGGANATLIKFATMMPQGAPGDQEMRDVFNQLEKDSGGEIRVQIYAGGVAGDESDVIRRMRANRIQMSVFTGNGLGQIYPPVRVLETPNLIMSYGEEDHIKERLFSELAKGFERNGYILLGIGGAGFVHVFSKREITSVAMIKSLRTWTWRGDPVAEIAAQALEGNIVPLHIADVNTGLQTGMIDTVYITTMGCMALQWHSHVRYMLNYPVTMVTGGMVINKRTFDGLSPKNQELLRKAIWDQIEDANNDIRMYNAESSIQLEEAGVQTIEPTREMLDHLIASSERAVDLFIQEGIFNRELYNRVISLRDEYRKKNPEEHWRKNVEDMLQQARAKRR